MQKTPLINHIKAALFAFIYIALPGGIVLADDTEVFFGGGTSGDETVRPNVLFILDTSGSMGAGVAGTGMSRMDNMKEALQLILDTTTNINVGLMRFNNPGGPILFPASYIDKDITEATTTPIDASINSQIKEASDDAQQVIGGGGETNTVGSQLTLAYGSAGSASISIRVSTGNDDAEEDISDGDMSLSGGRWDMRSSQINGVRFRNTGIPQGASILSASLELRSRTNWSNPIIRLWGQDHDDPPTFTNSDWNISSRTRTTASVLWHLDPWNSNETYTSPDISSIIQEIVNRPGWQGDDLVLIQTHDSGGSEGARTFNNSSSRAPLLNVTYSVGAPGQQSVGLRFQDIGIPQGATITSAALEFIASTTDNSAAALTIKAEANDNPDSYAGTANNITGRSYTGASVNWSPDPWVVGTVYQSPDLSALVQEVVNRPGWCGNNAMAFNIIAADAAARAAISFEGDTAEAPVLRISYDPNSVPTSGGCINQYLVYRIDRAVDDAEQYSNGNVTLSGTIFNMQRSQTNGLRFQDVLLEQGAQILEANIDFVARTNDTGTTSFTFRGEDADNAPAFSTSRRNISNRTPTSASVTWSPTNWTTNGTYSTPDLKTILQEIVNRPGWSAGNNMAFIQTGSSNTDRRARTFNNQPGSAPLLRIKVQHGGTAEAPPKTVRSRLKELVDDFVPRGMTPVVDTLYEAASYYRGEAVLYGLSRGNRRTFGRVSHPDSYTGGTVIRQTGCTDDNLNATACRTERIDGSATYTSPIEDTCQTNYIVVLTDGSANSNHSAGLISSMIGSGCESSGGSERCGRDLARWLSTTDQSSLSGTQTISTYTIGFNLNSGGSAAAIRFLQDVADAGNGSYFSASTSAELATVFQTIVREILAVDTSFVSPGATVNQFNRLTHRNEIFFSLFKPDQRPLWPGNLKRYELRGNPAIITDQNGDPAIDAATGFFKDVSQSDWSTSVDGNDVTLGGAASKLRLSSRKVFTNMGGSSVLSNTGNKVDENNNAISKSILGIDALSNDHRSKLLQWARGVDILDFDEDNNITEARLELGDPLHSRPVIVTYGGTEASPDMTVYFATNQGFLHAINGVTGEEQFSFIPQELLPNLNLYFENSTATSHPYGLDGAITTWVNDINGDGTLSVMDGDHAYLYIGMRRGGNNYYALDVTDRDNPELLWTIQGGTGSFAELGQTWSKPIRTKIKQGSTVKNVLIFSGGYDTAQDDNTVRTIDSIGRAIFIVDATTGALIWSGGPEIGHDEVFPDMQYSIPADIRVIDTTLDHIADQMYVGDMGGQIWRFDINNGATSVSELIDGGVIADFSGNAPADNRRFYYPPDIAVVSRKGQAYLSIAIGSGWRAHPLDTAVENRFYAFRDYGVFNSPSSYPGYTESDLYDVTDNVLGQGTDSAKSIALSQLDSKEGWYIQLTNSGEKVLAQSLTINNHIIFSTFEPNTALSTCSAGQGTGRVYAVSAFDATPSLDMNNDSHFSKEDREAILDRGGIPPEPTALFPKDSVPVLIIGTEQPIQGLDMLSGTRPTYWHRDKN